MDIKIEKALSLPQDDSPLAIQRILNNLKKPKSQREKTAKPKLATTRRLISYLVNDDNPRETRRVVGTLLFALAQNWEAVKDDVMSSAESIAALGRMIVFLEREDELRCILASLAASVIETRDEFRAFWPSEDFQNLNLVDFPRDLHQNSESWLGSLAAFVGKARPPGGTFRSAPNFQIKAVEVGKRIEAGHHQALTCILSDTFVITKAPLSTDGSLMIDLPCRSIMTAQASVEVSRQPSQAPELAIDLSLREGRAGLTFNYEQQDLRKVKLLFKDQPVLDAALKLINQAMEDAKGLYVSMDETLDASVDPLRGEQEPVSYRVPPPQEQTVSSATAPCNKTRLVEHAGQLDSVQVGIGTAEQDQLHPGYEPTAKRKKSHKSGALASLGGVLSSPEPEESPPTWRKIVSAYRNKAKVVTSSNIRNRKSHTGNRQTEGRSSLARREKAKSRPAKALQAKPESGQQELGLGDDESSKADMPDVGPGHSLKAKDSKLRGSVKGIRMNAKPQRKGKEIATDDASFPESQGFNEPREPSSRVLRERKPKPVADDSIQQPSMEHFTGESDAGRDAARGIEDPESRHQVKTTKQSAAPEEAKVDDAYATFEDAIVNFEPEVAQPLKAEGPIESSQGAKRFHNEIGSSSNDAIELSSDKSSDDEEPIQLQQSRSKPPDLSKKSIAPTLTKKSDVSPARKLSLVDELSARKTKVVSFHKSGPSNQGRKPLLARSSSAKRKGSSPKFILPNVPMEDYTLDDSKTFSQTLPTPDHQSYQPEIKGSHCLLKRAIKDGHDSPPQKRRKPDLARADENGFIDIDAVNNADEQYVLRSRCMSKPASQRSITINDDGSPIPDQPEAEDESDGLADSESAVLAKFDILEANESSLFTSVAQPGNGPAKQRRTDHTLGEPAHRGFPRTSSTAKVSASAAGRQTSLSTEKRPPAETDFELDVSQVVDLPSKRPVRPKSLKAKTPFDSDGDSGPPPNTQFLKDLLEKLRPETGGDIAEKSPPSAENAWGDDPTLVAAPETADLNRAYTSDDYTSNEEMVYEEKDLSSSAIDRMEWEASLASRHQCLADVLRRVEHRIVEHIVDSETAVTNIVDDYARHADFVMAELNRKHVEQCQELATNGDKVCTRLLEVYRKAEGEIRAQHSEVRGSIRGSLGAWKTVYATASQQLKELDALAGGG